MEQPAPAPVFITEGLEPIDISRDAAKELIYRGHHNFDPVFETNGRVLLDRGAMAVLKNPEGAVHYVFVSDPDDLEFDDIFIRYNGDIERFDRTKEPEKLTHPNYMGQFFKDDDRVTRVLLVATTENDTFKEVTKYIAARFAQLHLMDIVDNGVRVRENTHTQSTKTIVYEAKEHADSTQRDVWAYVAPHRGWEMDAYYTSIKQPGSDLVSKWRAAFLNLMAPKVYLGTATSDKEADALIMQHHAPCARRLRRAENPFLLHPQNATRMQKIGASIKYEFARVAMGLAEITKADIKRYAALPTAGALAYQVISSTKECDPVAALKFGAIGFAIRMFTLLYTQATQPFDSSTFEDKSPEYWSSGDPKRRIQDQFGFLDPEIVRRCRVLPRAEIPHLATNINTEADAHTWLKYYIIDTTLSPLGTQAHFYKVGNQPVILTKEPEDRSGLSVEYWPHSDVGFARVVNPLSQHLPNALADIMRALPLNGVLMTQRVKQADDNDQIITKALTHAEYMAEVEKLKQAPAPQERNEVDSQHALFRKGLPHQMVAENGLGKARLNGHFQRNMAVTGLAALFAGRRP